MRPTMPIIERVRKYTRPAENGCWEWIGSTNGGYGKITINKRTYKAHRVTYELFVGPIPAGLDIDHLCRNHGCVNPAHLEPVTRRENLLRGVGTTARNAAKTHCPRGHAYTPENTHRRADGSRRCRICGRAACSRNYLRLKALENIK